MSYRYSAENIFCAQKRKITKKSPAGREEGCRKYEFNSKMVLKKCRRPFLSGALTGSAAGRFIAVFI